RDTVDAHRGVLGYAVDDGGNLGHHPPMEIAMAGERTRVDELQASLELPAGPNERDHQVEGRGLVADPGEQLELEGEEVRLRDVPEAAPVADHRLLLDRLELLAASQPAELVAAEVDRAVHDRPRGEGGGDAEQRVRHPPEELVTAALGQQLAWVHAVEGVRHPR